MTTAPDSSSRQPRRAVEAQASRIGFARCGPARTRRDGTAAGAHDARPFR